MLLICEFDGLWCKSSENKERKNALSLRSKWPWLCNQMCTSPMLGHWASSQTVLSFNVVMLSFNLANFSPCGARCRSQLGFLTVGSRPVCGPRPPGYGCEDVVFVGSVSIFCEAEQITGHPTTTTRLLLLLLDCSTILRLEEAKNEECDEDDDARLPRQPARASMAPKTLRSLKGITVTNGKHNRHGISE